MQGPEHGKEAKRDDSHDGVHGIFFVLSFIAILIVVGNCYKGCKRVKKHRSDVIPSIEQRNCGIVVEFYDPRKNKEHYQLKNKLQDPKNSPLITPLVTKFLEAKKSNDSKYSTSSFQSSKDEGIVA